MLVGTRTTVTGLPRVKVAAFTKTVRRRASRGSKVAAVLVSVVARDAGVFEVLAHWEVHNPEPSEAWERADEVVWRSLIEMHLQDGVDVVTSLDT